jgi:hypothetical protein
MRLTSITIQDLAAFAGTHTFLLHPVTLIEGDHGVGKSSLGEILLYAFGRRPLADPGGRGIAHDPSLLHGNAEKGEAVIAFDDGMIFRLVVTVEQTTRQVKMSDGKRWNSATPEFIDSLVNALSYDPFTFKDLDEKKRIEALLKASPVQVSVEEFSVAIGELPIKPPNRVLGLEDLNACYVTLYDLRRDANSRADVSVKHADELEKALPAEMVEAIDVQPLRAAKEALEQSERDVTATVGKLLQSEKDEQEASHLSRKTDIAREIDAKIEELQKERARRYEESQSTRDASVEDARQRANTAVLEKRTAIKPELERLTAEIATAEERALRAAQDQGTREAAKKAREAATVAQVDSAKIDASMTRFKVLKEAVAGRLAVPGITIASPRAGQPVDICRLEGEALVPFSRWNEADKERFCLRMAVLFHGKCGMVFVDEIGHFTEERRAGIIAAAKKYSGEGMQFIMGAAKEGPLRVVEG